jgi:O-antigen ligase
MKLLLLLAGAVLALSVSPEKVFIGWLFCAPFVQGASAGPHHGHAFYKFLFLTPPMIVLARAALGEVRIRRLWVIDAVPALYVGYILIRVYFFPTDLTGDEASMRALYAGAGISMIAYYFTAFGRTRERFPIALVTALLWPGVVIAMLALIDAAIGWNLWDTTIGGHSEVRRIAATFSNPAALGTYLGAGVAFALAVLFWRGPKPLRLPAALLICLSIPALYVTYTRGPILGIAVVAAGMALLANRARWPSLLLLAGVTVLLLASWSHISSSSIYQERLGVTSTVTTREAIQSESLNLFSKKPLFGWGYNTFDNARLTLPTRDPRIQSETSHDTYLTVLVELGVTGLVLLVLPWIVISWRAVRAARENAGERWILAGCVGAAISYWIGALSFDARFFSLISALPWLTLGLARRTLGRE